MTHTFGNPKLRRCAAKANNVVMAAKLATSNERKRYRSAKSFGAKIALDHKGVVAVAKAAKRKALRTLDSFCYAE